MAGWRAMSPDIAEFDRLFAAYQAQLWSMVPIPAGKKGPAASEWQLREWLPGDFSPDANVGVILGQRSFGLVDVDLDCREALALADVYLPPTGAVFGRKSKPRSHRLYIAPEAVKATFADPLSGEMLLELRAAGKDGGAHQTLLPPSIADSERRAWEGDVIDPALVEAEVLHNRCSWLAIACLIERHISPTAARRPGHDMPKLLYEADPVLGRKAFAWLGLPDPDAPQYQPKRRSDLSASEIALWELASAIPNSALSWDDWNAYGLAFYAAASGSEEGFLAFDRFSAQCGKYSGPETQARWRHYHRSPPSATGIGKLINAALSTGWRPARKPGGSYAA
jgi:Bifunctional DNA primase/polymerase, N-terminal/Primase C terminal 2 (PriCT-2)